MNTEEAWRQVTAGDVVATEIGDRLESVRVDSCTCVHAPEQHWHNTGCEVIGCPCVHRHDRSPGFTLTDAIRAIDAIKFPPVRAAVKVEPTR